MPNIVSLHFFLRFFLTFKDPSILCLLKQFIKSPKEVYMLNNIGKCNAMLETQLKYLNDEFGSERREGRPFVTISRQAGAYGTTIAQMLAEYLVKQDRRKNSPWIVFDHELLKKVTEEHDFPETIAPYLSESAITEIDDILEELFGLHPAKSYLVHKMSETILHLANVGHVILVGREQTSLRRSFLKDSIFA
jgi:hypothetical protein